MYMRKIVILFAIVGFMTSCAKPVANFMVKKEDNTAPSEVSFINESKKADSYLWDFGDGNTSTEESPEHKYFLSGKYNVKLVAKKGDKQSIKEQELLFDPPHDCLVLMETNYGNMTIRLYDETPKHRDNFIKLAETGFYDDILFHRVIDGFMIQGGDPESKNASSNQRLGSGGPGYTLPAEFNAEYVHVRGALAAARQGDAVNPQKRSSGSQFYIVDGRKVNEDVIKNNEIKKGIDYTEKDEKKYMEEGGTPFLDMEYTVFGIVEKGLDVIDKIASVRTGAADRPKEDVKILKVRVIK